MAGLKVNEEICVLTLPYKPGDGVLYIKKLRELFDAEPETLWSTNIMSSDFVSSSYKEDVFMVFVHDSKISPELEKKLMLFRMKHGVGDGY